jgi:hypothetical protein
VYFLADGHSLELIYEEVERRGITPKPVVLPLSKPSDLAEASIWMDVLTDENFQGCGHVAMMMKNAVALYKLNGKFIAKVCFLA